MLSQVERPATLWSDADALRFAWHTLTGDLRFFVGIIVAGDLVFQGLEAAKSWLAAHGPTGTASVVSLVSLCLGLLLPALSIRIALRFYDGGPPTFADVALSLRSMVPLTLLELLFGLVVVVLTSAGIFAATMIFVTVRSLMFDREAWSAVVLGGMGAGALVVSMFLVRWVVDRQLGGHIVVDQGLWPRAAFRLSTRLVRPVRWRLIRVTSLLLGVQVGIIFLAVLIKDFPPDPRLHLPHIATGWPPAVNELVIWILGSLAALDGWLLVLAMSFAYRTLTSDVRQPVASPIHMVPGPSEVFAQVSSQPQRYS